VALCLPFVALECGVRAWYLAGADQPAEDPSRFHIYVVGGSTAEGAPYNPLNFGLIASHILGGVVDGREIEVHSLGRSGASVYSQAVGFSRVAATRSDDTPGAVFIYAGHNERIDPDDPDSVGWLTRLEEGLMWSAGARELLHLGRRWANAPPDYSLPSYGTHLERIVASARGAGLQPIISTVAGNPSGVEPTVERLWSAELQLEISEAIEANRASCGALSLEGEGLEPLEAFLRGRCYSEAGDFDMARAQFQLAVDRDRRSTFGRATSAQNALVRELASALDVPLVDTVSRFEAASPGGIVGYELLADGQHPNIAGYFLIATGFADALSQVLGLPFRPEHQTLDAYLESHPLFRPERALVTTGSWLLSVSVGHPWPQGRMDGAERAFDAAIAVDPPSFSGWLGLAIARAARDGLLGQVDFDELARWGFDQVSCLNPTEQAFPGLLARLREAGTPDDVLDRLSALYPPRCADQHHDTSP